jgi:hypothetical protein
MLGSYSDQAFPVPLLGGVIDFVRDRLVLAVLTGHLRLLSRFSQLVDYMRVRPSSKVKVKLVIKQYYFPPTRRC